VWKAFQEAHPQIDLQLDEQGGNATKILTQLSAGTPPDTAYVHPNDLTIVAAPGGLQNLDGFLKNDKSVDIKIYNSTVLEYFKFKGVLLLLPYYSGPSMLYYNKTLFKKYGVKLPEEYDRAGQWQWETGFLEAARQLTRGGGDQKTYGFGGLARIIQMVVCPIWCQGGDVLDWKTHGKAFLNTGPTLEALQLQADLVTKYGVVPAPADEAGFGSPGSWGHEVEFAQGKTGMLFGGRFWGPLVRQIQGFDVGMWHHPKGKAGRVHRNGPNGYGVLTGAKNPAGGWEWCKFFAGPTAQAVLFSGGRNVPITTRKEDLEGFRNSLTPWENGDVYLETNTNMRAIAPLPAKWGDMSAVYGDAWSTVISGKAPVQTAMDDVNRQWEALLKQ
jgi:ABC-type glycerol-3-phosphate transport system substrate-binding protein